MVPIVLYNGLEPWTAPLCVSELIEPLPGFERHLPEIEYLAIDEGHLPRERLEPLDSPVAGVFQLEQATGVEEIRRILDTLIEVLDDPELRELRRDMATWIRRAVLPARLPGIEVPELQDLQEAKSMLAERAATWPEKWKAEGYQSGKVEGYQSGKVEGLRLALNEQAEARFGSLETHHRELLAQASESQLRRWLKEILDVASLDDLFHD